MSEVLRPPVTAAATPPGPLREFWIAFSANRGAVIGLFMVVFLLLVALAAPLIAPHEPFLTNTGAFLRPPAWQAGGSLQYLLGTDAIGRDILSRLIYGARLSLSIGLAVVMI
jgi:dipeptide transport system permease protein